MTGLFLLLAGCWAASVVAFLVAAATAPLLEHLGGDS